MDPQYLAEIKAEDISDIYRQLEAITVPLMSSKTAGRAATFGPHRAMTLGMIRARRTRQYGLSANSKKYPQLYEAIMELGRKICPIEFTAIHVNHNVVCPRHLDGNNVGQSVILSMGDYDGCRLMVEGYGEYDTLNHPLLFDGSKAYHWNTPLTRGNKYSLVFFNYPQ